MMSQLITEEIAEKRKPVGGNLEVRILRSVPEIEEIRDIWKSWNRHPNSDIDLYLLLMQTRPEIVRPHIIVLYRNGNPVAMLIGRIVNERLGFKLGYKSIFSPSVTQLSFVTGGLLGELSPESCEFALDEIKKALRRGEADVATFHNVRSDTPIFRAARKAGSLLSRDYLPALQNHRSMLLPNDADELYTRLSAKVRKNLRWQTKKLAESFPDGLKIQCFSEARTVPQMLHDTEEIASKTYQRALGVGFANTPEMRERIYLDAQKGRLRSFVLYVVDKPCAFWLGTLYQGTFHSGYMGYDPTLAKYSPGMFLIMKALEEFCARREVDSIETIDFGLGDAQYKEVLGNRIWQDATIHIFAPSLRGFAVNLLRTPILISDRVARRIVRRTGSLRLKKTWRNILRP